MTSLLEVGLINAAMATGLALVVWLATRMWRHPVFVHTLWIVVLLKLITPPVVSVPRRFIERDVSGQTSGTTVGDAGMLRTDHAMPVFTVSTNELSQIEQETITLAPIEVTSNPLVEPEWSALPAAAHNGADGVPAQLQGRLPARFPISWTTAAITIWLTGTAAYLLLSAVRLAKFHRALSHAAPASADLQQLAAELAPRFGVANRYQLRVTEGQLSPLVWPIGKPTILMPRRLLAELSPGEAETLLAHEFAHLCRRDHWLRWLELVVTAAYWWHPVVWWAKAAIQRAEERVCDAWVVTGFPDAGTRYASALFKAVQFASADRQAAPIMASALGGHDLKERIEHIMNATWKPRLFLPVRVLVLAAAIIILPLSLRAIGEEDQATQPVVVETEINEDESTATDQDAAATTEDATDHFSEKVESTAAESVDAATTDALDAVVAGDESPAASPANPFAELPAAGARPGMQPRRVPVPADPYHIAAGDVLFVSVIASGAVAPVIDKDFVVEPSGSVALGPQYGRVKIGSLSLEDAEKVVAAHLKETLREPMVQITIGGWRDSATQAATKTIGRTSQALPFPWESRTPGAESATKQMEAPPRRSNNSRRFYPELTVSTAAPAVSESMGVLKKIVQRSEQDYQRLKELADNNTVSTAEVARARSEYEISVERLKQGERALRFYRAQVEWAEAEFQTLDEANKRAPGSVTELDLRRAKLAVELARAKFEELAE